MFGIGPTELIVILVLALIVLGPQKFPEAGRQLGKAMREFRATTDSLTRELSLGLDEPTTKRQKPNLMDDIPVNTVVRDVPYTETPETLAAELRPPTQPGVPQSPPAASEDTENLSTEPIAEAASPPEQNEPGPV